MDGAIAVIFSMKIFNYLTLIFISITIISGRSYSIEEVDIKSTILINGILSISEIRKWKFEGKFNWVQQTIVKNGFVTIYDIQLSEYNNPYENRNNEGLQTFQIIDRRKKYI